MSVWFDVDKNGLAKLLDGKPKSFILFELIQNAWDQDVTKVEVSVEQIKGTRSVRITVQDDDPNGFADLSDAFTLFAESRKKGNVNQRGRFNLGEKLVLALATEATIISTSGTVCFSKQGRTTSRKCTASGSVFMATIPMSKSDMEDMLTGCNTLIQPTGVATTINGSPLVNRQSVAEFWESLPTVKSDDEGNLRPTVNRTLVKVYHVYPGETASLYEMGIPVVATGDKYHVDIGQKVPLNMDRDNVTPSYLRKVRTAVLNNVFDKLDESDVTETWVREATGDEKAKVEAVKSVLSLRFGDNAVAFDPSDTEANKRAMSEGRTIIYGNSLSKGEWANLRETGAFLPAGQVTPSAKPYSPDGRQLKLIPPSEWTDNMQTVVDHIITLGKHLLGRTIVVQIANETKWRYNATYGPSGVLVLNVGTLGYAFFDRGYSDELHDLLIHEFGHEYSLDHLSEDYYCSLTKLGAKLVRLALTNPEIFVDKP